MKKTIWLVVAILFQAIIAASVLTAGYRADPWGSKTWTGPGRPPHWSPEASVPRSKPSIPGYHREHPGTSGNRDGMAQPHYRYKGQHDYWKEKNYQRNMYKKNRAESIYYKEPEVETVIIERERHIPVYLPVQRKPSRVQCSGETITNKDQETGILTIVYVSGAKDCP